MNTEDSEFQRIEREQAMRGVPDAIHHTDTSETLEYITGWNDCRAAMLAEQPAPVQQEPVAVVSGYYGGQCVILPIDPARIFNSNTALYTSPPAQRKPLTDDELSDLWYKQSLDWMEFARAIEAAHGITAAPQLKENT